MPLPVILIVAVLLLVLSAPAAAADGVDDYLSAVERDVLDELNHARTDPQGYAGFLSEMKPYFKGNRLVRPGKPVLITHEGVAAVDEAIEFLQSTRPVDALRPSKGLSKAARMHVEDQQNGEMGHTGSDGSQPWDRMSRYGTWQDGVAENISYGGYSARGVVIQLIVDDGVPGRGHRTNIFNPTYRFAGVGCGAHARFHDMCVIDFAARYADHPGF